MENARFYYGRALMLLNSALKDDEKATADETLLGTMFLALYEMWSPDSLRHWILHTSAMATLIKLRGPSRHRTGLGRDLFDAVRNAMLYSALESKSACFLDQPEWRTLVQETGSESADAQGLFGRIPRLVPESEMLDVEMTRLTFLFHDVQRISRAKVTHDSIDARLAVDLQRQLEFSRQNLDAMLPPIRTALESLREECSTPHTSADGSTTITEFLDVYLASAQSTYWYAVIVTNCLRKSLEHNAEKIAAYDAENKVLKEKGYHIAGDLARSRFSTCFTVRTQIYIIYKCVESMELWANDNLAARSYQV